jgi:hypothetical protein
MHGAEQQAADAQHQPHQADMIDELGRRLVRLEDSEQRRIEIERQRRERPDRQ